jgi:hypothetical protein
MIDPMGNKRQFARWVEEKPSPEFGPLAPRYPEYLLPLPQDCTAEDKWWEDVCWYTDEEKWEEWRNAYWLAQLGPRKPLNE